MKSFSLSLLVVIVSTTFSIQVRASDDLVLNTKGGLYIHELKDYDLSSSVFLDNQRLLAIRHKDKNFLIYGIPYDSELGENSLEIKINNDIRRLDFNIKPKFFDTQKIRISSKYSNLSLASQERVVFESNHLKQAKDYWYNIFPDLKFTIPANGIVTGRFGTKRFYNGQVGNPHNGLDIGAEKGTKIMAPSAGKIILTGHYYYNGKFILLDHGMGLKSIFIHLDEILVEKGQLVKKGELIGKIGNTGKSSGPHLHWSLILNKTYIDPEYFLNGQIIDYFSLKVE